MNEIIDEILAKDVEEVIASPLSLQLLKVYSTIYLNGAAPGICAKSQRKYYKQLKDDYQMNKEILERTCVPSFEGLRYIPGVFDENNRLVAGHVHITGATITDAQALKYLEKGILKENDFKVLPKGYKKAESFETIEPENEDLNAVLDRDDFNELRKEAKKLGLKAKNPSKEDLVKFIQNHIDGLN